MIPRRWYSGMSFRARLGFEQAVRSRFEFLETHYGMRVVQSEPTLVRYESEALFVNVYHGRSSYELAFEVGRKSNDDELERPFRPDDFIRLSDPEQAKALRYFAATTFEEVERGVERLAADFRGKAERAFTNADLFETMKRARLAAASEYADDVHERQTRPKAEAAFRRGDFAKAARLYESFESRLAPSERRKLEISRRKANERDGGG